VYPSKVYSGKFHVSFSNYTEKPKVNNLIDEKTKGFFVSESVNEIEDKCKYKINATGEAKPLIDLEKIRYPRSPQSEQFVMIVDKNHDIPFNKKIMESDNFDFIVVETDNLTRYLNNEHVVKICDVKHLKNFINYSKEILRVESEEKIKKLQLRKNIHDVIDIPQLIEYMEHEDWDVQPGQASWYQQFVTPYDSEVQKLSRLITTPEEAYSLAVNWLWVSDQKLHNKMEKWLHPREFIADTSSYPTNPAPGRIVSDCSEQANTLVSILRAIGFAPQDVRVALGKVNFGGEIGGHAWVEIKENGRWMVLDPTCGPYFDEEKNMVVNRDGVNYYYWRYHPYPIEEIWIYYNDVYFTDKNEEVAPGWSTHYDVFTESDLYAGFVPTERHIEDTSTALFVVASFIITVVFLFFIYCSYNKKKVFTQRKKR